MSSQKIKQGYLQKYAKSLIGNSWKKVYVELYKDGSLFWYKKRNDRTGSSVSLPRVREYLTVGSYCRAIPFSPTLPSGGNLEHMVAVPQEPNKKSKIHFFLCYSESEFNEWMAAIVSTLPSPPATPAGGQPATNLYAPSPYGPSPLGAGQAPPSPYRHSAPPQMPVIGFEGLTISGNPASPPASYNPSAVTPRVVQPYYPPPQQPPYPPQPYPQQPSFAPPAPYPQQPSYPPPPQQTYPSAQQQYPQYPYRQNQGFPQNQGYPQNQGFPQNQGYPQNQGFPQNQGYPQYQGSPQHPGLQPRYPPQPATSPQVTYIQQAPPAPPGQTVIIRDGHRGSPGLAAGILGGAVAGYAASRMYGGPCWGGWGYGHGWGHHGSWGSGSWGSGSWGSCSGGSWGSWD